MSVDFDVRGNREWTFSQEEASLWIKIRCDDLDEVKYHNGERVSYKHAAFYLRR